MCLFESLDDCTVQIKQRGKNFTALTSCSVGGTVLHLAMCLNESPLCLVAKIVLSYVLFSFACEGTKIFNVLLLYLY